MTKNPCQSQRFTSCNLRSDSSWAFTLSAFPILPVPAVPGGITATVVSVLLGVVDPVLVGFTVEGGLSVVFVVVLPPLATVVALVEEVVASVELATGDGGVISTK